MVVGVIFSVVLKNEKDAATFLEVFKPLVDHSIHNEPGTLDYELHERFEDGKVVPFAYIVLERYHSLHDFEEIHLKSAPFAKFFEVLSGLDVAEQSVLVGHGEAVQAKLNAMPPAWSTDNITDPLLKKGVLIFGGSRHGAHPAYAQEARKLGECVAMKVKRPLVYGGGTVGLMGEAATAAQKNGGKVVAVIPKSLCPREASGDMIGDMVYYSANMSERKSIMFAHSDTVVALPGGAGTFDELLEVITLFQLNAYRPKIGIVNANSFFEPFLAMLRHLVKEGFLEESVFSFIVVRDTAEGVMDALSSFVPPASPAASLAWHCRP